MIFTYGVDLAETLNYCGIICLAVENNQCHLQAIRKFKNIKYPQIRQLLLRELFPTFPPQKIAVDYTSEKSFSEELEAQLNPLFLQPNTPYAGKWQYVEPIKFTNENKLMLKQNARRMLEFGQFKMPVPAPTMRPEVVALIEELEQQMMRETAEPTSGELSVRFPKPEGHDNDLIIALELALYAASSYITGADTGFSTGEPIVMGFDFDPIGPNYEGTPVDVKILEKIKNIRGIGNIVDVQIRRSTDEQKPEQF